MTSWGHSADNDGSEKFQMQKNTGKKEHMKYFPEGSAHLTFTQKTYFDFGCYRTTASHNCELSSPCMYYSMFSTPEKGEMEANTTCGTMKARLKGQRLTVLDKSGSGAFKIFHLGDEVANPTALKLSDDKGELWISTANAKYNLKLGSKNLTRVGNGEVLKNLLLTENCK